MASGAESSKLFAGGVSLASFQLADVGGVEPTDALERFLYDRRHLIAGDVYYIIQDPISMAAS